MTVVEPVAPAYDGGTLGNLLPSALTAVGRGSGWDGPTIPLPEARYYVVLLVDGLGWELLRRYADRTPYFAGLLENGRPLTTGIPSTTATSLTSLGTGLEPGRHGIVGYTCRVPGTNRLLNALQWNGSVDPEGWQPHPTMFEHGERHDCAMTAVSRPEFSDSGLTVAGMRGSRYVGADDAESVAAAVSSVIDSAGADERGVIYAYHRDLDRTGHEFGCETERWRHELAEADALAERLRELLPADVALVVTGDHGMVDVPPAGRIDVDAEPDLDAGVAVLGGESRFRYLYVDGGPSEISAVIARWKDRLGDDALVLRRDEAIERGWFGPVEDRVRPRFGDVVVATLGRIALDARRRHPHEARLVGVHGSLSADEMLVPLLVDPA